MVRKKSSLPDFSPADRIGLAALFSGAVFLFIDTGVAVIILTMFLALMALAPFITGRGIFLKVTARGRLRGKVALTLDDGPDPGTTSVILEILARYGVRATFFVTGENAEKHPELMEEILSHGHFVGNHSYSHDPLIMLKGKEALKGEVKRTQEVLARHGIVPGVFRPPAGITSPVLGSVLHEAGLCCVNFSVRALDRGNRRVSDLSRRILKKAGSGDIIMIHDITPVCKDGLPVFFNEVEQLLRGLGERGLQIIPLDELTGIRVMVRRGGEDRSL